MLLLHGTGGNERSLLDVGRFLDPNAGILSPRGNVLEGMYPRFFRRIAPQVLDLEDLRMRTDELAEFVGKAAQQYGFDADKVVELVIPTAQISPQTRLCATQIYLLARSYFMACCLKSQMHFPICQANEFLSAKASATQCSHGN